MKPYVLKRLDKPIALINLNEEGTILKYELVHDNIEFAPLHDQKSKDWLKKWWSRRAIPLSQKHVKDMLERKGLLCPEDYLVKNFGLSLTDYYWISPIDSQVLWKDVNLFINDFYDDINIAGDDNTSSDAISHYTPNSTLQGTLEKSWTIRKGKRGLVKGNQDHQSTESINEVIASKLHEQQGFNNYTTYKLIEIHGKPYNYGCFSEIFTSEKQELISAYDIVTSEKRRQNINTYEHFINVCASHGLAEDTLRPFLEYQIMTDFILSNRDRHLTNISILRDADSLNFIKPAPIYDSGKSMFVNSSVPLSEETMLKINTESFLSTELKLLSLVRDRTLVDTSKLPSCKSIKDLYSLDSHMDDNRINDILRGYEMKINLFERWQKGENLNRIIIGNYHRSTTTIDHDIFV